MLDFLNMMPPEYDWYFHDEKKGSPIINWRLCTIPQDAAKVLSLREKIGVVRKSLEEGVVPSDEYSDLLDNSGQVIGIFKPMLNEVLAQKLPDGYKLSNEVNQPFLFLMPSGILRIMSYFRSLH